MAIASSDPYVLFSANTRARSISPMNWGTANPLAFLVDWRIKIGRMDPKGLRAADGDPHVYLVMKLFRTLPQMDRPGTYAWEFIIAGAASCIACFAWIDCSQASQVMPHDGTSTSRWDAWCPVIVVEVLGGELVPYYWPCLAWGNSRPKGCHISRLRSRGLQSLPSPRTLSLEDAATLALEDVAEQPAASSDSHGTSRVASVGDWDIDDSDWGLAD